MVPPQKNIFLLLYCIIFDNKFLLILRNSKLLSINFLCVTLSHMSIRPGHGLGTDGTRRLYYLPSVGFCGSDRGRFSCNRRCGCRHADPRRNESVGSTYFCLSGRHGRRFHHRHPAYRSWHSGHSGKHFNPDFPVFHQLKHHGLLQPGRQC